MELVVLFGPGVTNVSDGTLVRPDWVGELVAEIDEVRAEELEALRVTGEPSVELVESVPVRGGSEELPLSVR